MRNGIVFLMMLGLTEVSAQFLSPIQLFRPRLDVVSESFLNPNIGKEMDGNLGYLRPDFMQRTGLGLVIPLRSKITTDIGLKFDRNSKTFIKPLFKISGSQSLLSLKGDFFNIYHGKGDFEHFMPEEIHAARLQVGYSKLVMNKLRSINFYLIQANVFTEINRPNYIPNIAGATGKIQIKSLTKFRFYALAGGIQNRIPFIMPIIGTEKLIAPGLWTNLTFPVQARLSYSPKLFSKVKYHGGLWLDGFGINATYENNLLGTQYRDPGMVWLKAGLAYERKSKKSGTLILRGGYAPLVFTGFASLQNEPLFNPIHAEMAKIQFRNAGLAFFQIIWQMKAGKGLIGLGTGEFSL